jgi:tocopherol cyclase
VGAWFEGWYFKHCVSGRVLSLIPGEAADASGRKTAFLQVISSEGSHFYRFPHREYRADPEHCVILLGDSFFSRSGIRLSVHRDGADLEGAVAYSNPQPIRRTRLCPTAMGPLAYLPLLECRHDIVSLSHGLSGSLTVNGERIAFDGGTGYIEKDAGRSFPEAWLWYQCCGFEHPGDSAMVAAASVQLGALRFPGLLCIFRAAGEEHRLATYLGGRVTLLEKRGGRVFLEARQRDYRLRLRVTPSAGQFLLAPALGDMRRGIREYPCCDSRILLTKGERVLLNGTGGCAGFEWSGKSDF